MYITELESIAYQVRLDIIRMVASLDTRVVWIGNIWGFWHVDSEMY